MSKPLDWDDYFDSYPPRPGDAAPTSRSDSVPWSSGDVRIRPNDRGASPDTGRVEKDEPLVRRRSLMDHPAVRYHGSGVSTWDLSTFIARISDRAEERVVGIGHEQYGHLVGPQKFETYTPEEEYEELLDEIADAVAYLAFVAIKAGHVTRRTVAKQEANRG